MGLAKARGTYEERKAAALERERNRQEEDNLLRDEALERQQEARREKIAQDEADDALVARYRAGEIGKEEISEDVAKRWLDRHPKRPGQTVSTGTMLAMAGILGLTAGFGGIVGGGRYA